MTNIEPLLPCRDEHHWGAVLGTVSLDFAKPYLHQMGLTNTPEKFLSELRSLILAYRSYEPAGIPRGPHFAVDALTLAIRIGGARWARYFRDWGDEVFQAGGGRKDLFVWSTLLGTDPNLPTVAARTPKFVSEVYNRFCLFPPISRKNLEPESNWDREIYRRAGYDNLMNAAEFIIGTVRTYRFWMAWEEAIAASGPPSLEELLRWGRERASVLHIPDDLVEPPAWGRLPRLDS